MLYFFAIWAFVAAIMVGHAIFTAERFPTQD